MTFPYSAEVSVNYLTTLGKPSFRVEGACFKPPDFHFYRPHTALRQRHILLIQQKVFKVPGFEGQTYLE